MGAGQSRPDLTQSSIKPELVASALIGEMSPDDYLGQSMKVLENFDNSANFIEVSDYRNFIDIKDAMKLVDPELTRVRGVTRGSDGTWYISSVKDLGDVTGEMYDWWFRVCEDSEMYKWWHPRSHFVGDWDLPFYARPCGERETGYYVGHSLCVTDEVNGQKQIFTFEFERPSKHFDTTKFPECGVTACICARINRYDNCVGWIRVGHMIHLVREVNGKNEVHVNMWIGEVNKIEDESVCHPGCVNCWGNSKIVRTFAQTTANAKALSTKIEQEILCVRNFLPNYYDKCIDLNRVNGIPSRKPQPVEEETGMDETLPVEPAGVPTVNVNSDFLGSPFNGFFSFFA